MSEHWKPAKTTLESGVEKLSIDDIKTDSKLVASKLHMPYRDVIPLITPVYHATNYKIKSVDHYLDILKNGGYIYSRLGNPSCEAAECALNAIEGGAGSLTFPSGMAAITTALSCFLHAGDHVVCCNPVYSGTHKYITKYLSNFNIDVTFVTSGEPVEEYKKAIKPNTKVLYGETPCNPLISILDLEEFGKLGQNLPGVVTMVDSTLASPYCQQPIKYGIDICHAVAKKQMNGFSGMIAFEVKGGLEPAKQFVQGVNLIQFAVSLGGVESLVEHAASMTHGPMVMSDEERQEAWITDGLIRFSVGIEDPNDLVEDLKQALDKVSI